MLKTVICTILALLPWNAYSFMEGRYEGTGEWKNPSGEHGTFRAVTSISQKRTGDFVLFTEVRLNDGREMGIEQFVRPYAEGFYTIFDSLHREVGRAYCFDMHCHLETSYPSAERGGFSRIEETWTFESNKLHKLGSRTWKRSASGPEGFSTWQENAVRE